MHPGVPESDILPVREPGERLGQLPDTTKVRLVQPNALSRTDYRASDGDGESQHLPVDHWRRVGLRSDRLLPTDAATSCDLRIGEVLR